MGFDSRQYEFADIKVSILGKELSGLRGIKYKKIQEKEHVYGAGNKPKGIQRGNKKYEGTLKVLKTDFDMLNQAAVLAGYEDIVDVPGHIIDVTVVYQKPGALQLNTDKLINLEFSDYEDGMDQGDKYKEIELPFLFLSLKKG